MRGSASTGSSTPFFGRALTTGGRRHDLTRALGPAGLAHGHGRFALDLVGRAALVGEDVALVEPHLHTDASGRCLGLAEPVVDVGSQRVQRHPTLAVPLGPAHLRATEAARALHADAECTVLLGGLHRTLHGPSECHPAGELVGDTLSNQRSVEFGLLDLLDVELHLGVARDLGEPGAEAVGLAATAADHDAGTCGVHVDAELVARALDLDAADGGMGEVTHHVVADLPVLDHELAVLVAVGEPARLPLGGDAQAEPVRIDLLTHDAMNPRRQCRCRLLHRRWLSRRRRSRSRRHCCPRLRLRHLLRLRCCFGWRLRSLTRRGFVGGLVGIFFRALFVLRRLVRGVSCCRVSTASTSSSRSSSSWSWSWLAATRLARRSASC